MHQLSTAEDEIISFPVPKRYLPVVIQALAKAMNEADSPVIETGEEKATSEPSAKTEKIDWTVVENMKRLKEAVKNLQVAFHLFEMTAEKPGEWIPFSDIYPKAGFDSARQAGSSLGALTKIIKRDFGVKYEDVEWPVHRKWGVNGDAQYYYQLTPELAQVWKTA